MGLRDQKEMMEGARSPGHLRNPLPPWTGGLEDEMVDPSGVDKELGSDNGDLTEDESAGPMDPFESPVGHFLQARNSICAASEVRTDPRAPGLQGRPQNRAMVK